jgi:hypothetical protein
MPSRLLAAFPTGVPVSRVPLDKAIARIEQFLPRNCARGETSKSMEKSAANPSTIESSFDGPPPPAELGEDL